MKVYKFIDDLPRFSNPVLTIGTFDGVHVGHRSIISKITSLAKTRNGESILLTFHPHPRLILNPEDFDLKLINTLDEKITLFEECGIDHLIIATFTDEFSHTEPRKYINEFLVKKIRPQIIVIGYDHRFGANRMGDIELLKEVGKEHQFEVLEISKQLVEEITVSSTKIRRALQEGEIEKANQLLGRNFLFTGKVIAGDKLGKQLGYPTANIFVKDEHKIVPGIGVYAAYAMLEGNIYKSMLYIGYRPTFSGTEKSIEVNIFKFQDDIYDKELTIEVMARIRPDEKFDSTAQLVAQLARDKQTALKLLD